MDRPHLFPRKSAARRRQSKILPFASATTFSFLTSDYRRHDGCRIKIRRELFFEKRPASLARIFDLSSPILKISDTESSRHPGMMVTIAMTYVSIVRPEILAALAGLSLLERLSFVSGQLVLEAGGSLLPCFLRVSMRDPSPFQVPAEEQIKRGV
jgi:hypothetical protein